ncbi:hypothetical protein HRbin29_00649 [bacterium HR29]|nr:hypothetical protein HRbin29_00649 [bacterium HR29]
MKAFMLRLDDEYYELLRAAAQSELRSLGAQARWMLIRSLLEWQQQEAARRGHGRVTRAGGSGRFSDECTSPPS